MGDALKICIGIKIAVEDCYGIMVPCMYLHIICMYLQVCIAMDFLLCIFHAHCPVR